MRPTSIEPTTKHAFVLTITIADELAIDADDLADRVMNALAPQFGNDPIFGDLCMKNGHEALLAVSLQHVGAEPSTSTFELNYKKTLS